MAWIRLDDNVPHHPKILTVGPVAAWLWVCGIAYAQRQLTDGVIPREAVPTLGVANPRKHIDKLVTVGLWDEHPRGWQVHDYLAHNSTREEATTDRACLSAKRSAAGKAGMARRWGGRTSETSDNKHNKPDNKPITIANNKPITPSHPIPSDPKDLRTDTPVPRPTTETAPPDTPSLSAAPSDAQLQAPGSPASERSVVGATPAMADASRVSRADSSGAGAAIPGRYRCHVAAPLIRRRRRDAAFEAPRVYVPQRLHDDLIGLRNHAGAAPELLAWYARIADEWTTGPRAGDTPNADMFAFWRARFAEQWPPTPTATPAEARLPAWARDALASGGRA